MNLYRGVLKNLRTAIAAALFITSTVVNATTITFDDLVLNTDIYTDPATHYEYNYRPVNPIDSLGFRFSNSDPTNATFLGVWPRGSSSQADDVGHAAVLTTMGWTTTTMTSLTPTPFN